MVQQPLVGQCLAINAASWLHSVTHATLSRNTLDEVSAHHRDLYLTTFRRDRHPCALAGFEPKIPASQQLQTHALDCVAAGISMNRLIITNNFCFQACLQSCKMCLLAYNQYWV